MNENGGPTLHVRSDLRLVVGDVHADLTSDGQRLRLHTNNAPRLLAEATTAGSFGPSLRRTVGQVAHLLDVAGLSAQIDDGRGTLLELGHGCGSLAGRLVLGTHHARLGTARALRPAAASYVLSAVRRRVSYASAGLAVAVLLGVAGSKRHQANSGAGSR